MHLLPAAADAATFFFAESVLWLRLAVSVGPKHTHTHTRVVVGAILMHTIKLYYRRAFPIDREGSTGFIAYVCIYIYEEYLKCAHIHHVQYSRTRLLLQVCASGIW